VEVDVDTLLDILGRISPGHLIEEPRPVISGVYLILAAIFVVVAVVAGILYLRPNLITRENRLLRRIVRVYTAWYFWLGFIGVGLIGLRYLTIPLFSKRIWTVLDVLALLAVTGHIVYYYKRTYQDDLEDFLEAERRRRFMPQPRRPVGARRRTPRKR
jgi:hypothetical protein